MKEESSSGWAVTIRFSRKHDEREKEQLVKGLFREIMNEEHVELAYTGTYVTLPAPHAHFIVFGGGKNRKPLKSIDKMKWKRRWAARSNLNIQAIEIVDIYEKEGWKAYIQKNVQNDSDSKQIYYNVKMLKRLGEIT